MNAWLAECFLKDIQYIRKQSNTGANFIPSFLWKWKMFTFDFPRARLTDMQFAVMTDREFWHDIAKSKQRFGKSYFAKPFSPNHFLIVLRSWSISWRNDGVWGSNQPGTRRFGAKSTFPINERCFLHTRIRLEWGNNGHSGFCPTISIFHLYKIPYTLEIHYMGALRLSSQAAFET